MKFTCLLIISFFSLDLSAQICLFEDDYSDPLLWTQVGSLVNVEDGVVNYVDGAPGESQRRVYRNTGLDLESNGIKCWDLRCEFTPQTLGTYLGQPFVAHYIVAFTAGIQEPLYNCPNIPCTGYPNGDQDGIIVVASAKNPPNGETYISLRVKDETLKLTSENIIFDDLGVTYYIQLERLNATELRLSVYSDDSYTEHLEGSPISMEIPETVENLTHIQHGNSAGGDFERELTGTVDNTCLSRCSSSQSDIPVFEKPIVKLYPNPANNLLNIESSSGLKSVRAYSTLGQEVFHFKMNATTNNYLLTCSDFTTGIYLFQIETTNGTVFERVIIGH